MKLVLLIGTSHDYQRVRGGTRDTGPEQLRAVIAGVAVQHGVRAIAEEMSPEALVAYKATDSVGRQVAAVLGIAHRLCDPESTERQALGYREDDDIRMAGFFAGRDHDAIEAVVRASYAIRERRWLEHLLELDLWPVLFICGANHVESFEEIVHEHAISSSSSGTCWF
jgi:hypothetical protein